MLWLDSDDVVTILSPTRNLVEGYKTVYLCHLDSYTVTVCNGYLVLALHELDFFLYFSSENSILSCVTVGLQHICSTLKKLQFSYMISINYTHFQIKHWNMLYHVHTCIAIFFHISYNPVSTHSINQNNYYKLCFTKTVETLWLTKPKRIFTLFLISQNVAD